MDVATKDILGLSKPVGLSLWPVIVLQTVSRVAVKVYPHILAFTCLLSGHNRGSKGFFAHLGVIAELSGKRVVCSWTFHHSERSRKLFSSKRFKKKSMRKDRQDFKTLTHCFYAKTLKLLSQIFNYCRAEELKNFFKEIIKTHSFYI